MGQPQFSEAESGAVPGFLRRNPVPVPGEEAGLADVVEVEDLLGQAFGADCQSAVRRHARKGMTPHALRITLCA